MYVLSKSTFRSAVPTLWYRLPDTLQHAGDVFSVAAEITFVFTWSPTGLLIPLTASLLPQSLLHPSLHSFLPLGCLHGVKLRYTNGH